MKVFFTIFSFSICCTFLMSQNPVVTTLTNQFNGSGGVKLGPDGFLYIADFGASLQNANGFQVWRIDRSTGDRTVFATGLQGASGNDFDSQGNLFQSNIAGNWIAKITPDGSVSSFTNVGISAPVGIAIDPDDNLYVCNCGSDNIQKVTPAGVSTLFSSGTIFNCPNGATLDNEGNLYVSNFGNSTIVKITPDGNASFFASILGSNNGHLTFFEPDTMLYINSHGSSSVYRATLGGVVTKIAGTGIRGNQDGPALDATFSRPNGVALSVTGDTLWLNSSIPLSDVGFPLNPSVVRMITGLKNTTSHIDEYLLRKLKLNISPIPVNDFLKINMDLPINDELTVQVFDLNGQLFLQKKIGEKMAGEINEEIKTNDLGDGVYVVVMNGQEFSVSEKIIVVEN